MTYRPIYTWSAAISLGLVFAAIGTAQVSESKPKVSFENDVMELVQRELGIVARPQNDQRALECLATLVNEVQTKKGVATQTLLTFRDVLLDGTSSAFYSSEYDKVRHITKITIVGLDSDWKYGHEVARDAILNAMIACSKSDQEGSNKWANAALLFAASGDRFRYANVVALTHDDEFMSKTAIVENRREVVRTDALYLSRGTRELAVRWVAATKSADRMLSDPKLLGVEIDRWSKEVAEIYAAGNFKVRYDVCRILWGVVDLVRAEWTPEQRNAVEKMVLSLKSLSKSETLSIALDQCLEVRESYPRDSGFAFTSERKPM
jgi:hypothetical protein